MVNTTASHLGGVRYGLQVMSRMANIMKLATDLSDFVASARTSLQKDNIIAVPTDTIYGIAGLAQSTAALKKIYEIKGRDSRKPVSICVGQISDIYRWAKVVVCKRMLCELLPGPVTVVFERTLALNPDLNPGTALVGIRIPNHGFIRQLCQHCGEPLALTSANVSNESSTLTPQEFEHIWPKLDLVFDGGRLEGQASDSRCGSTVVDLSKAGSFTIIRRGSAFQDTYATLKKYGLAEEKKS